VRRRVGARPPTQVTADDLLARTGHHAASTRGTGVSVDDVHLPAELLADLHHPFLIITPDYVGPPRRVPGGHGRRANDAEPEYGPSSQADGHRPTGRRSWISLGPLVAVVALTAATVAPLTLAVAHWLAH
jgi:hypothetical protein